MQQDPQTIDELFQGLQAMPLGQWVFYILAGVTWIGGVNLLFLRHRRRAGTPSTWWPFARFTSREWLFFFSLLALAMTFGTIGLSFRRQ